MRVVNIAAEGAMTKAILALLLVKEQKADQREDVMFRLFEETPAKNRSSYDTNDGKRNRAYRHSSRIRKEGKIQRVKPLHKTTSIEFSCEGEFYHKIITLLW